MKHLQPAFARSKPGLQSATFSSCNMASFGVGCNWGTARKNEFAYIRRAEVKLFDSIPQTACWRVQTATGGCRRVDPKCVSMRSLTRINVSQHPIKRRASITDHMISAASNIITDAAFRCHGIRSLRYLSIRQEEDNRKRDLEVMRTADFRQRRIYNINKSTNINKTFSTRRASLLFVHHDIHCLLTSDENKPKPKLKTERQIK